MDPETRKTLDKIQRRERWLNWLVPVSLGSLIVGIAAFWFMPRETLGDVAVRLERIVVLASDDDTIETLLVTLPDGKTIRTKALPGDAALAQGAQLCLARSRHPVLRTVKYFRVPNARCTEESGQ